MYKLVAAILLGNGVGGRMATAPHYSTSRLVSEAWLQCCQSSSPAFSLIIF